MHFIFMLTKDDATVGNAMAAYEEVRDTALRYVGFKDIGAPIETLMAITALAHEDGREVMLEVVSTTEEAEARSLRAGLEIGVDWVLGGTRVDLGTRIFAGTGVRYCPFPGRIIGHPSVLDGDVADIVADARRKAATEGVHGLDLLAYRHPSVDPILLTREVVQAVDVPVIVAGSIDSHERIALVETTGAWGFTIGGAIFDSLLPGGPDLAPQIAGVLDVLSPRAAQP